MADDEGGDESERPPTWDDFHAPWETFMAQIDEWIEEAGGRGKHHARNAVRHMQWAFAFVSTPEAAAYHAIAAEEEAATAIFCALQRLRYRGAERLDRYDHYHKAAVVPFLGAVSDFIGMTLEANGWKVFPMYDTRADDRRLKIGLWPRFMGPKAGFPNPPLHGTFTLNGELYDFRMELQAWAAREGKQSPRAAIKKRANRRNDIWYAHEEGIPSLKLGDAFLTKARDMMYGQLAVFLLIDQYAEHQSFVQQALDAFLRILPPRGRAAAA